MATPDRGSREEDRARRASSFSADLRALEAVVRKSGVALERLFQLVLTRVVSDEDMQLAEELADEVKPLIDALIHFEVPRG